MAKSTAKKPAGKKRSAKSKPPTAAPGARRDPRPTTTRSFNPDVLEFDDHRAAAAQGDRGEGGGRALRHHRRRQPRLSRRPRGGAAAHPRADRRPARGAAPRRSGRPRPQDRHDQAVRVRPAARRSDPRAGPAGPRARRGRGAHACALPRLAGLRGPGPDRSNRSPPSRPMPPARRSARSATTSSGRWSIPASTAAIRISACMRTSRSIRRCGTATSRPSARSTRTHRRRRR